MKKIAIGLLTALMICINVSTAHAAFVCHICGARVVSGSNHSCCDYLGHDTVGQAKKNPATGKYILWRVCKRCNAKWIE